MVYEIKRRCLSSELSSVTPSPEPESPPISSPGTGDMLQEDDYGFHTNYLTTKGWNLKELVESSSNFEEVARISALETPDTLLSKIKFYEASGRPFIIQDWHRKEDWDPQLFGLQWLLDHQTPGECW